MFSKAGPNLKRPEVTNNPNVVPNKYKLKKSRKGLGPILNKETPNSGLIKIIAGTIPIIVLIKAVDVRAIIISFTLMGATKRFAELILQSLAVDCKTRMTMVRFGNVIGSSGSAIPLFQQQIKNGGPVTVTHKEVTRYFMSIPEAAQLVIQAGAMGQGGDVFVLDMGEPVEIYELAKRLINLSGMEVKDEKNPNGDIEIVFTGLRPGEKLYEELLIGDNVSETDHKQILRAEEISISSVELEVHLKSLKKAEENGDVLMLIDILKKVVSGFSPEESVIDIVHQQNLSKN